MLQFYFWQVGFVLDTFLFEYPMGNQAEILESLNSSFGGGCWVTLILFQIF